MNFGTITGMGGAVAGYLATQEGQAAVKQFLASPEGIQLLQNFAGTSEGKQAMLSVLPNVLGGLNLPSNVTDAVNTAIQTQKQ